MAGQLDDPGVVGEGIVGLAEPGVGFLKELAFEDLRGLGLVESFARNRFVDDTGITDAFEGSAQRRGESATAWASKETMACKATVSISRASS